MDVFQPHSGDVSGSTEVQNSLNIDYFHYYLTGGGVISVNNMIKVRPNAMLKVVKGAPAQLDINANVLFNDFICCQSVLLTLYLFMCSCLHVLIVCL
jgi:hypothetical protein